MRTFCLLLGLLAVTGCQRGVPHRGGRLDVDWTALQRRCEAPSATQQAVAWTAYLLPEDGEAWLVEMRSAPGASEHGARLLRIARLTAAQTPKQPYTQRLPSDTVTIEREQLRFGDSTLNRSDDGARFDLHVVADAGNGRHVTLDAVLERSLVPWQPGPTTLPNFTDSETCVDLTLLAPHAKLSGSVTLDGKTKALRGTAYLDRVAWLTATNRDLLAWYRGVAHADGRAAVFFRPLQRSTRSWIYFGNSRGCQLCATDAPLMLPLPGPSAQLIDLSYVRLGRVLRWRTSLPAFEEVSTGGTALSQAMLDVSNPQGRKRLQGPTVISLGSWRTK